MQKFDMALLEKLCLADGVSGFESAVCDIIIDEIKDFCNEVYIDTLGNVIAFKKGNKTRDKKVMLCTHMDEVGLCIKGANDDGTMIFDTVGLNADILPSKRVTIGKEKIKGVISSPPVHLKGKDDEKIKVSDLYIDAGLTSKQEAEKYIGEYVCFDSDFVSFGNGFIKAKALDDRVGCAVMCAVAKQDLEYDTYFCFTVGEEVGGVGAAAAANQILPDICIILEATTASDIPGNEGAEVVCKVGEGAVCPFMDGGTLYDNDLYTGIREVAKKHNIKCQTKLKIAGGTDASKIQKSGQGVRVCALSLPTRYIHTPTSVANCEDMESMLSLCLVLCDTIHTL